MPTLLQKRCICGRSDNFPVCDGRHGDENWRCNPSKLSHHPKVILAPYHYHSLAERLSHTHDLVPHHLKPLIRKCDELIVINDGTDFSALIQSMETIGFSHLRILNINSPNSTSISLQANTVPTLNFILDGDSLGELLESCEHAINAPTGHKQVQPLRLFVSHSVLDEALITPVMETLRKHYQMDIFLCGDSIEAGADWQQHIHASLENCDLILAICSVAFSQSTFCAYEIGLGRGLSRQIIPICIDSSPVPSYLQHLNAPSVNRIQRSQPWLSTKDALLHAIFKGLQSKPNRKKGALNH